LNCLKVNCEIIFVNLEKKSVAFAFVSEYYLNFLFFGISTIIIVSINQKKQNNTKKFAVKLAMKVEKFLL
jgi:hypothetical protein